MSLAQCAGGALTCLVALGGGMEGGWKARRRLQREGRDV